MHAFIITGTQSLEATLHSLLTLVLSTSQELLILPQTRNMLHALSRGERDQDPHGNRDRGTHSPFEAKGLGTYQASFPSFCQ